MLLKIDWYLVADYAYGELDTVKSLFEAFYANEWVLVPLRESVPLLSVSAKRLTSEPFLLLTSPSPYF